MKLMADAAYPTTTVPPGSKAIAGYLGGDAAHIWTADEWALFSPFGRLPIWVASTGSGGRGDIQAEAAITTLHKLGVPQGKTIALDLEMRVAPGFVYLFTNVIRKAGWRTVTYGSESTIFQNPTDLGVWVAHYDGIPNVEPDRPGHPVVGTQYAEGTDWDLSMIRWTLRRNLW